MTALDQQQAKGITPQQVAATIVSAVEDRRPRPLYAVGSNAPAMFALRRLLPRTVIEKVIARAYGLSR